LLHPTDLLETHDGANAQRLQRGGEVCRELSGALCRDLSRETATHGFTGGNRAQYHQRKFRVVQMFSQVPQDEFAVRRDLQVMVVVVEDLEKINTIDHPHHRDKGPLRTVIPDGEL
jgi:hypothetical protein